jgi:DNA polymerase-4
MVEKLAFQLRSEEWLTSTVVIKIRYSNFDTETKQCRIPYTSADHTLTRSVTELFDKLYQRRMRLRLIGIRFSGLVRGTYQINMFEDTEEMLSLYQAMDRMKKRYGFDAVARCAGATLKVKANNVHQLSPYHSLRYGTIPLNELVQQASAVEAMALTEIRLLVFMILSKNAKLL